MSKLRRHLHAAKDEHLLTRYPGDLASEILSPKRSLRPMLWLAPLAAAAVVAVVLWTRVEKPSQNPTLPGNVIIAATNASDDALFAVKEIPSMQSDLGISPSESGDEASFPSFSEVSAPEMPPMPSFDFSSSESST